MDALYHTIVLLVTGTMLIAMKGIWDDGKWEPADNFPAFVLVLVVTWTVLRLFGL